MSDYWELAERMKKETDNWPQWKRSACGLPPVNHDLLAERAPPPPADLVQATQDGEHPAIHAPGVEGMKAVRMPKAKEAADG